MLSSADWETAVRITSEYGGGTSVAGLGFEASYGLTDGSVYSVSVGNAVEYLGTVGHIETRLIIVVLAVLAAIGWYKAAHRDEPRRTPALVQRIRRWPRRSLTKVPTPRRSST